MVLDLYLELSYFLRQIFLMGTVTEVTKVPKFLTLKVTVSVVVTKLL